jgi:hypothetical protein
MNKGPTNALEKPMYYHINLLLHVSVLQRHYLQGVHYVPAELLPNVMKAEWDEGRILLCLWWDVAGQGILV